MDLDRIAPEAVPGIRILPVLHDRVELGAVVAEVLDELDPALVAVELPTTLAEAVGRAIARLPRISVVISEEAGEDARIWLTAPGDPFVEALRWAAERGRPTALVDPDLPAATRSAEAYPDPHAIHTLGAEAYLEIVRRLAQDEPRDPTDELRERGMAHHLKEAAAGAGGPVLALVGAAHADRVAAHLAGPTAPPLARQRRTSVQLRHLHPESLTAVLHDPPLAHAVHELLRQGPPPPEPAFETAVSRRVELVRDGLRILAGEAVEDAAERARSVAAWAAHHGVRPGEGGRARVDRGALAGVVWRIAAASWAEQTRNAVAPWQRRLFFDFARRYARVRGLLVPGLYEWLVAARGGADDNLAWEAFDTGRTYPWQHGPVELESARIDGEMLDLGSRRVRFRRRFFKVKQRLVPVRSRPTTDDPARWLEAFDADGICSYPPEDLVVEDYGRFLQRKAISILAADRRRSEPFTTSLLDGVDLRETLLRWHEGRVWVQETGRAPGRAGSVVAIFDEDPDGTAYPYLLSWLGEHEQESDMALYATDPTCQIVGPGIMRATYGGFMLTYPPGRLYDVWRDPDYRRARSKAEVLTMAAVDYSLEKLVVSLAPKPPTERMRSYASSRGRRIVHVPLGSVSPVTVRRIRVVHILAGRDKRAIASDYVW
jgi:hypothetical protein